MSFKPIAVFAAALTLAACGQRTPEPASAPEKADAAVTEGPAVKSGPFDVTERGVGALGPTTPWTAEAIGAAFPGVTVEKRFLDVGEGGSRPMLRADGPDGTALEAFESSNSTVAAIVVLGGPFMGPGGVRLLTPWAETGFKREQCRPGEGRWIHAAYCRRPENSAVAVVFSAPGWTDPARLPDEATLREKARVQAFVWSERP